MMLSPFLTFLAFLTRKLFFRHLAATPGRAWKFLPAFAAGPSGGRPSVPMATAWETSNDRAGHRD